MAVVIAIDRIAHDAAGHELRHADGAGVRAARLGVQLVLQRQGDEVAELAAEHVGALGLGGIEVVECQRRQGVDHAEVAHVAAIQGFHADDGGDDRGRHAVALGGAVEQVLVGVPEFHAPGDALGFDETPAIGQPAAPDFLARRAGRGDEAGDGRVVARAFQAGQHLRQGQLALRRQLFGEGADVGPQFAGRRQRGGAFVARYGFVRADADAVGLACGGLRGKMLGLGCLAGGGTAGQQGRQRADLQESPTVEHNLPYGDYVSYPPVMPLA
ncbi:Uncharacterised protein [Bordetella pertussis]|nr:Uncharacterised protein [Bordetella pertussis]CFP36999.1 Uncharacterised protein [Bordetella pertussis]CPM13771.1 Uncharacterised protein [Bordetella pertussis]CPP43436.1 Uncharacterised protein [Bordetella pertussis]